MKARLERRWPSGTVAVWLYRNAGLGHIEVLELADPADPDASAFRPPPSWRTLDGDGADPGPPTLELPEDALEALVAAGLDLRPPNTEQAVALEDARGTRDRLLELVEHVVKRNT